MEFSRQKYWSGLPFPTSVDLSDPGINPASLESPALAGGFFTSSTTWEAPDAFLEDGKQIPLNQTVRKCKQVK